MSTSTAHIGLYSSIFDEMKDACFRCAAVAATLLILGGSPQTNLLGLDPEAPSLALLPMALLALSFLGTSFCWLNTSVEKTTFLGTLTDHLDSGAEPTAAQIYSAYDKANGIVDGRFARSVGKYSIVLCILSTLGWLAAVLMHNGSSVLPRILG
jgi:hypothetical protein